MSEEYRNGWEDAKRENIESARIERDNALFLVAENKRLRLLLADALPALVNGADILRERIRKTLGAPK